MRSGPRSIEALLWLVRAAVFAVPPIALILATDCIPFVEVALERWLFPDILFPYVTWKAFVFRILVEVMVGLWVVLAFCAPRYRPRWSGITPPLVVFTVVIAVADLAGVDPLRSVWSNYERMEGLIGLLHLLGFFVVASSVLDSERSWRAFFQVSLGVCLLVCLDAVRQRFDPSQMLQPVPAHLKGTAYARVDARLASPVYLGVYLLIHMFLAAWCAVRTARPVRRVLYGALGVLALVVLWWTQTRFAQVGLAGGVLLALVCAARGLHGRWRRLALAGAGLITAAVVSAAVLVWIDPGWLRDLLPQRFYAPQIQIAVRQRLLLWEMVLAGFADRPLLGWGQENFAYLFDRHFHPDFYGAEVAAWWDHPHNALLNWLAAGGIVGLAAFVWVWVASFVVLWRPAAPFSTAERCLFSGLLGGYLVFGMAQPDNLISQVLWLAVLACVQGRSAAAPAARSAARSPRVVAVVAALAAVTVVGAVRGLNVAFFAPAMWLARARNTAPFERVVTPSGTSTRLTMQRIEPDDAFSPAEFCEQLAELALLVQSDAAARLLPPDSPQLAVLRRQAAEIATGAFEREAAREPQRVRVLFGAGYLASNLGQLDRAAAYLKRALALAPKRQILLFELGRVRVAQGAPDQASALYRRALALAPDSLDTQISCAVAAILSDDRALEQEMLDRLRAWFPDQVFRPQRRIVEAWMHKRRGDAIVAALEPLCRDWSARHAAGQKIPRGVSERFATLASGYYLLGDRARAIAALRAGAVVEPAFAAAAERWIASIGQ